MGDFRTCRLRLAFRVCDNEILSVQSWSLSRYWVNNLVRQMRPPAISRAGIPLWRIVGNCFVDHTSFLQVPTENVGILPQRGPSDKTAATRSASQNPAPEAESGERDKKRSWVILPVPLCGIWRGICPIISPIPSFSTTQRTSGRSAGCRILDRS